MTGTPKCLSAVDQLNAQQHAYELRETSGQQVIGPVRHSGEPLVVLYVGDWDPSGLHMSVLDLPTRLTRYGGEAESIRLALQQSDLEHLPSFPVESRGETLGITGTDESSAQFVGNSTLNPVALRERLAGAMSELIDHSAWNRAAIAERADCESLAGILATWPLKSNHGSKCPRAGVD